MLVVNDEPLSLIIILNLIRQVVILPEDNLKSAENGHNAVELCKNTQFDLVLMDLNMPVMNGFVATRLIRQNSSGQKPYIVGLSASNVTQELLKECQDAGFNDLFAVPLTASDLKDKIINKL